MRSRPASSTRMVSLPPGLQDSPSAVRKHAGGSPSGPATDARSCPHVEMITVAPQPFPAHRDRRAARRQRLLRGVKPRTEYRQAPCLANRSAATIPAPNAAARRGDRCPSSSEVTGRSAHRGSQHLDTLSADQPRARPTPHPQLVLILDRAGDRPRPPADATTGDRTLTPGPPRRTRPSDPTGPARPGAPTPLRNSEPRNVPIPVNASASASVT